MDSTIKPIFQSSVDPSKVSMTVQGITKFVISLVAFYAVQKGFDPTSATTGIQQVSDVLITIIPAGFAVFHGMETIYGLIRKAFVKE